MNIKVINKLQDKTAAIFFLTNENLGTVSKLLPAGFKISVDNCKADEMLYHITASQQFIFCGMGKSSELKVEKIRKTIHTLMRTVKELKLTSIQLVFVGISKSGDAELITKALAETVVLSSYDFIIYKTESKEDKKSKTPKYVLKEVSILTDAANASRNVEFGVSTAEIVCSVRDMVNEPPNVLNPTELANRALEGAKKYGYKCEVFRKEKIKALKMGGILAVNRGSQDPPTFSILEWKPAKAKNKKPIVLVGKGITFDTGGLSLKATAGSMDYMKCDMAGAAVVIGVLSAVAHHKLPYHIIGLCPSTDNRPGENAYTPNDVITMYSGKTVEVLNTDAEGRMILADALHFAKQYNPELVIDLATLTGSAVIAVGECAIAMMTTASEDVKKKIHTAGNRMHERLVELPLWEEYGEQIKSDIADIKNVGGKYAGAITAGKFLEHFIDYPWVHLDIAGVAYLHAPDSYRGKNGTGAAVRLLVDFIENY